MTIASLTPTGIGTWNSKEQLEQVPLRRLVVSDGSDASSSISGRSMGWGNSIPEDVGFASGLGRFGCINSSSPSVNGADFGGAGRPDFGGAGGLDLGDSSSKNKAAASLAAWLDACESCIRGAN